MQLTTALKATIHRPGVSIHQLMALADIAADPASQQAFWTARRGDVQDRTGQLRPDEYLVIERAREVCFRLIEWRIQSNELCLMRR